MKASRKRKPVHYADMKGMVHQINLAPLSLEELEKVLDARGSASLTYRQVVTGIKQVQLEKTKHERGSALYVKYSVMELILSDRKLQMIIGLQKFHRLLHATI
ncbi:hypothetical protein [Siphonobacter sp. SORGH_AS_1065]|uniref:hypothetical protein n=1 Tax=Siphonobacter sp. SORGH_AS_1065 TaxID=3041795 RepID=UPI00277F9DE2|nr:hypothetical protein [Siphonobacter sp. SORGH_AS_1065]MDQ1085676.1 hypothetical protein [Siphonobacter sp. SORGH_AS_1065]